jgi:hypothetical protein
LEEIKRKLDRCESRVVSLAQNYPYEYNVRVTERSEGTKGQWQRKIATVKHVNILYIFVDPF